MESISREWEQIHHDRGWGKYPIESVIRFVARNYYGSDRGNTRILDFGCGQGANTWYLAREGFDTYAFDGSLSAVEKTREYLQNENLTAKLDVMDAVNITYQDKYFDAVIDSVCIGHNKMDAIKTMYSQIHRILKDGGKLYTAFFTVNTTGFGTGECLEKNTYNHATNGPLVGLGVGHYWEEEEFKDVVTKAGFKDISIETYSYTDHGYYIESYILTAVK